MGGVAEGCWVGAADGGAGGALGAMACSGRAGAVVAGTSAVAGRALEPLPRRRNTPAVATAAVSKSPPPTIAAIGAPRLAGFASAIDAVMPVPVPGAVRPDGERPG